MEVGFEVGPTSRGRRTEPRLDEGPMDRGTRWVLVFSKLSQVSSEHDGELELQPAEPVLREGCAVEPEL